MIHRRDFIQQIGMGLSAMLFIPELLKPSWKHLMSPKPFEPHWVMFNEEWLKEHMWHSPNVALESPTASLNSGPDYIYVTDPIHEKIYGSIKKGFREVMPFVHMPNEFTPKVVWFNLNEGFGYNHNTNINSEWKRAKG